MGRVTRLAKQRIAAAAAAGLDLLCNHSPPLLLLLLLLTPKMTNVSWQSDLFSSLSSASWPRLIQRAGAAPTVSLDGGAKVKVERRRQRFSSGILHRVFKCSIGAFSLSSASTLSTGNQGVICLCAEAVKQRERAFFCHLCICPFFLHCICPFFGIVFVHLLQNFSKELSGFKLIVPMMLGCGGELKASWENEINQGGSTSALVPHLPTSFC